MIWPFHKIERFAILTSESGHEAGSPGALRDRFHGGGESPGLRARAAASQAAHRLDAGATRQIRPSSPGAGTVGQRFHAAPGHFPVHLYVCQEGGRALLDDRGHPVIAF